jgi:hypothetical protein
MQRGWQALILVAATAFGVVAAAQEKKPLTNREREPLAGAEFNTAPQPAPKEFQALMRVNNGVIQADTTGTEGGGGDATATPAATRAVVSFRGSLGRYLATPDKEDWDGILKDAGTLQENFAKVEAFFADRKSAEGVALAKSGEKGVSDLATAAKAKNRVDVVKAEIVISVACRNCHIAHRVLNIGMPLTYGVIG